jgi:hypothetical protein
MRSQLCLIASVKVYDKKLVFLYRKSTKATRFFSPHADYYTHWANYSYWRWFKYDRDKLWLVYTQIVPVIFEPPCSDPKGGSKQLALVLLLTCTGCLHCSSVTPEACTREDRMATDDEVLITGTSFIVMHSLSKTESRRKSRWWMTSFFRSRDRYSGSDLLYDLRVENLHFSTFCRMSCSDFDALIISLGPRISKKDTSFRKAIPVAERPAVTLQILASGDSFTSLTSHLQRRNSQFLPLFFFFFTSATLMPSSLEIISHASYFYSQIYKTYGFCPTKPHAFRTHYLIEVLHHLSTPCVHCQHCESSELHVSPSFTG